jgi:Flp pilus assembly protein TadD
MINAAEGIYLLHAGRTDEALTQLRQTVELDPRSWLPRIFLASTLMEKSMFAEAISEANTAQTLNQSSSQPIAWRGLAQARFGQRAEARDALHSLLRLSRERYVPPYYIALVYNGLDEREQALTWLERGFEVRDPRMIVLKVEPKWNNLRKESRFISLLKRLKLST